MIWKSINIFSYDRSYVTPDYLTYGYDEFENDLYRELEESGIPNPYDKQGEEQPFVDTRDIGVTISVGHTLLRQGSISRRMSGLWQKMW